MLTSQWTFGCFFDNRWIYFTTGLCRSWKGGERSVLSINETARWLRQIKFHNLGGTKQWIKYGSMNPVYSAVPKEITMKIQWRDTCFRRIETRHMDVFPFICKSYVWLVVTVYIKALFSSGIASAFDSKDREFLWWIMAPDGMPPKPLKLINAYYASAKTKTAEVGVTQCLLRFTAAFDKDVLSRLPSSIASSSGFL